jgi:hypothetical protein
MALNTVDGRYGLPSIGTSLATYRKTPVSISGVANPGEQLSDITDFDHSKTITRSGGFTVDLGTMTSSVNFIIVSGHNLFNGSDQTATAAFVNVYVNDELFSIQSVKNKKNIFIYTSASPGDSLKVEVSNNLAGSPSPDVTVSLIVAGRYYQSLFNGGISPGYKYSTKTPDSIGRASLNEFSAPITVTKRAVTNKKGMIKIDHMSGSELKFYQKNVMEMATQTGLCFLNESFALETREQAIVAYNNRFEVKPHSTSRNLWSLTHSFDAFTGYE